MPTDIILYALIAAGLGIWLRSLLGMRHDGDRQRPNPFAESENGKAALPAPVPGQALDRPADTVADPFAGLDRSMAIADAARPGLSSIAAQDKGFAAARFLSGAQDAFVMIVEAFAAGDRATLRNLLTPPVLSAFEAVIAEREAKGERASVEIHAVRRSEIAEAWLAGRTAQVTVRFVADETNVLRGVDGGVISGNPDRVSETIDVWTFQRDVKSRDPSWHLCQTRDDDRPGETVPDAGSL